MFDKVLAFEKEYIGIFAKCDEPTDMKYLAEEKRVDVPTPPQPVIETPMPISECFCINCSICGGNKSICGSCLLSSKSPVHCSCLRL